MGVGFGLDGVGVAFVVLFCVGVFRFVVYLLACLRTLSFADLFMLFVCRLLYMFTRLLVDGFICLLVYLLA